MSTETSHLTCPSLLCYGNVCIWKERQHTSYRRSA